MENERSHSIQRARRRGRNWRQMLINLRRVSPRPCTSTVWTSIQLCSELCRQEHAMFVCFRDELHSASSCSLLGSTTEHRILNDKVEEKDEEESPKRESGVIQYISARPLPFALHHLRRSWKSPRGLFISSTVDVLKQLIFFSWQNLNLTHLLS
jgi:hypothetical protein